MVSRGVLYHQDKVEGLPVSQLCVPKGRRPQILCLAHYLVDIWVNAKLGRGLDCHSSGLD